MSTQDGTRAPARGTRPANRRALIIAAARDLFQARGFDHVAMSDIAEAVSIGPSALYRHFSGKQDLLFEVLTSSTVDVRVSLAGLEDQPDATWVTHLVEVTAVSAAAGALWQRESRHLTEDQRQLTRAEVRALGRILADRISAARPGLDPLSAEFLAWAALAVLLSPSFQHARPPGVETAEVLVSLVEAVLAAPAPVGVATDVRGADVVALQPRSRKEAMLAKAVALFADRGYTNVGIEEIGGALGISGPGVYSHFPTKIDVLETALNRGWAYLLTDLAEALATSDSAGQALQRLVRSYVRFAAAHPDVIGLLITETRHLPDESQAALLQAQRDYVAEWASLLARSGPSRSASSATTTVVATLAVVNDLVRTGHLRGSLDLERSLETLCTQLLLPSDR